MVWITIFVISSDVGDCGLQCLRLPCQPRGLCQLRRTTTENEEKLREEEEGMDGPVRSLWLERRVGPGLR